jgi:hypothetical protein
LRKKKDRDKSLEDCMEVELPLASLFVIRGFSNLVDWIKFFVKHLFDPFFGLIQVMLSAGAH